MPGVRDNRSDNALQVRPVSPAILAFRFPTSPSSGLLQGFADALDENGHLPDRVNRAQLAMAPYILAASTTEGECVGGCTIKQRDGNMAEIGFMLVKEKYRRLGLAQYMTRLRIDHARQQGLRLLYARVRGNNIRSMNNLRKAGFQSGGDFLGEKDHASTITWLYLALQPLSEQTCRQLLAAKLAGLVPVIRQR